MKQTSLLSTQQNGKEEFFVDLTIYNIPASLLKDFAEYVVRLGYPGGVSPAVQDLMKREVEKHKATSDDQSTI